MTTLRYASFFNKAFILLFNNAFFVLLFLVLMSFAACSDKDDNAINVMPKGDECLIMFYGVGGGNLDNSIAANIIQGLNEGSSDKLKLTYQYRYSKGVQFTPSLKGVIRFTAEENNVLKGTAALDSITNSVYQNKFMRRLKTYSIGGLDYVMASDTALASFVKWSKQLYPNATKSVLVIADHGNGWQLNQDGIKDADTRAILIDDNTLTDDNKRRFLSVGDIQNALQSAGKVNLIYDDACQMCMWENIVGYSTVADYFIGSFEETPASGGNYTNLVKLLNGDISDLFGICCKYVDSVIDDWSVKTVAAIGDSAYCDLGVYDLSKITASIQCISEIRKNLVELWNSNDAWKSCIRSAITSCEIACNDIGTVYSYNIPENIKDVLTTMGCKEKSGLSNYYYMGADVIKAMKSIDLNTVDSKYAADSKNLAGYLESLSNDSYSMADLLRQLDRRASVSSNISNNPFGGLRNKYLAALKECAYIRCSRPLDTGKAEALDIASTAYELCSPGVFMYSFDSTTFDSIADSGGRYTKLGHAKSVALYRATDFDKSSLWSDFLKIFDVVPSVLLNPVRSEIEE